MTIRTHSHTEGASELPRAGTESVPAGRAEAKPRLPRDDDIRVAYFNRATGEWEFYPRKVRSSTHR